MTSINFYTGVVLYPWTVSISASIIGVVALAIINYVHL